MQRLVKVLRRWGKHMADKITTLEQFWAAAERIDPEAWAKSQAAHAELQALRKDAELYRWLRDNATCQWDLDYEHVEIVFSLDAEEWEDMDDAVRRAMAKPQAVGAA